MQCEPRLSVATALKALPGVREYVHTVGALQSIAATYNMLLCQNRAKSFWMRSFGKLKEANIKTQRYAIVFAVGVGRIEKVSPSHGCSTHT